MGHLASEYASSRSKAPFFKYNSVNHGLFHEFKRRLRKAHGTKIYGGFYFLQTTPLILLHNTRMLDNQSEGQCDSDDIDQVIARCKVCSQTASAIREARVFSDDSRVPS